MKYLKSLTTRIDGKVSQRNIADNPSRVLRNETLKLAELEDQLTFHKLKMVETALLYRIAKAKQTIH